MPAETSIQTDKLTNMNTQTWSHTDTGKEKLEVNVWRNTHSHTQKQVTAHEHNVYYMDSWNDIQMKSICMIELIHIHVHTKKKQLTHAETCTLISCWMSFRVKYASWTVFIGEWETKRSDCDLQMEKEGEHQLCLHPFVMVSSSSFLILIQICFINANTGFLRHYSNQDLLKQMW